MSECFIAEKGTLELRIGQEGAGNPIPNWFDFSYVMFLWMTSGNEDRTLVHCIKTSV